MVLVEIEEENPVNYLTEVRPSTVAGLGLFARVDIPRGTVWWGARSRDVLLIHRDQYEMLATSHCSAITAQFLEAVKWYTYYSAKLDALILCTDNARFVNHSFTPNSGSDEWDDPMRSIALRDIKTGEEIFEDYTRYDPCPWATLYDDFLEELKKYR